MKPPGGAYIARDRENFPKRKRGKIKISSLVTFSRRLIFTILFSASGTCRILWRRKFCCFMSICEELVSMKALLDHVESAHNIAIEKETKKFDTYEAFKIWKEDVEKQTTALYVKNTGSKSCNMKKTTYFYCHRNGFYNARGDKKRTIKIGGSNKINGNCPSKMKVCEDIENQVHVEFTKTHLGHGKDLGRMLITREEKDELARKVEKKIPIQTIKHIYYICSRNLNEINSAVPRDEGLSVHSPIIDEEEEMVICDDRKFLEKAAVVDNLRVTSKRKGISKEQFQKEFMKLTNTLMNKALPEHYDNILNFLRSGVNSTYLSPQENQESVPNNLNMEPLNKKIKTQRYVSTKKTSQKTSTTFRKPTPEECQSKSSSLVLTAKTK
ncbi:uncharacterized protein NPIL_84821 [Nephila pilipes]|uniref:C2H2-type domain-containing protein n=1 Tax=Nephila pilipes TaxID=299642 RepID=A0A8X6P4F9_NEPPI|nr:uncharacterized protein NPIL_84821 [Nephila pilipes]